MLVIRTSGSFPLLLLISSSAAPPSAYNSKHIFAFSNGWHATPMDTEAGRLCNAGCVHTTIRAALSRFSFASFCQSVQPGAALTRL